MNEPELLETLFLISSLMSQALGFYQHSSSFGRSNLDERKAAQLVPRILFSTRTKAKCEGARGDGGSTPAEETFLGPIKAGECIWLTCRPNLSLLTSRPARSVRQGWWLAPDPGTCRCDMGPTWLWLVGLYTRERRIDQAEIVGFAEMVSKPCCASQPPGRGTVCGRASH